MGDMPPLRSRRRRPNDCEAPVLGCPPSAGPAPQPWWAQGRQLLGGLGEWDRCCDHAARRAWGHSGACSTPRLRARRSMATGACDIGTEGVPAAPAQRSRAERDKSLCWALSPILLQTCLPAPSPAPPPLGIAGTAPKCVFLHRHNYGLFAIARVLRGLAHFSGADAKSILQTIDDVHTLQAKLPPMPTRPLFAPARMLFLGERGVEETYFEISLHLEACAFSGSALASTWPYLLCHTRNHRPTCVQNCRPLSVQRCCFVHP